ncbi:reverse transcriptase/maturase family protein [Pseudomonas helleri]|uniref:reverse transcriptase/maturase family protein n=1 Tax=Pseudomonas helleri TaxID=1608996 RepID=UPI001E4A5E38|nr:reverse transcriptase/maturase family protein [Pseudomonas helleri]
MYEQIYAFDNLLQAWQKARRGKRKLREVLRFELDLEGNLIALQNELMWDQYTPGAYRYFTVLLPKPRQIASLPFRDRVLQHAINNIIEPIWEARFIPTSFACRPGRGTHACADKVQGFLRSVQQTHGRVYVLKADIAKFFASIHRPTILKLLERHISCPRTLALIRRIVYADGIDTEFGIPIGNLTSQLMANIYLHQLDIEAKHTLGVKFYARYMDDFCIVHHDKQYLHAVRAHLEDWLHDNLLLRTNHKTQVFPVAAKNGSALDFVGYRLYTTHRLLRRDSIKRIKTSLRRLCALYAAGRIDLDKVRPVVHSWIAHASQANTLGLRRKILASAAFVRRSETEAPASALQP